MGNRGVWTIADRVITPDRISRADALLVRFFTVPDTGRALYFCPQAPRSAPVKSLAELLYAPVARR